jgi:nucleotide-binding universal stress UspA family protein
MFKTILVPVDVSEPETAKPAIEHAVEQAKLADGTVRLIYVRSVMPMSLMEFIPPKFDTDQHQEAERKLAAIAAAVPLPEGRVSSVARMGGVYHTVLEEAERIGADLIIVGSHRPSMSSYLIGSNAATIVRHAPCSVLVVR